MEKNASLVSFVATAALLFSIGAAVAQAPKPADCQPSASPSGQPSASAPQQLEGEVVKIDKKAGMVTLRSASGTHEFRASPETLNDLKVGDKLEAKLRTPNC
jgi:Cu/Ag efflux protein CusF